MKGGYSFETTDDGSVVTIFGDSGIIHAETIAGIAMWKSSEPGMTHSIGCHDSFTGYLWDYKYGATIIDTAYPNAYFTDNWEDFIVGVDNEDHWHIRGDGAAALIDCDWDYYLDHDNVCKKCD
jgi:hypothetical protein